MKLDIPFVVPNSPTNFNGQEIHQFEFSNILEGDKNGCRRLIVAQENLLRQFLAPIACGAGDKNAPDNKERQQRRLKLRRILHMARQPASVNSDFGYTIMS